MADKTNYIMMLARTKLAELKIPRSAEEVLMNRNRVSDEVSKFSSQTKGKIISYALALRHNDLRTKPHRTTSPFAMRNNDLDHLWGKSGTEILNELAAYTLLAAMLDLVSADRK